MKKYILALDAGTTSNRAILFDDAANIVAVAQQEFKQIYPQPGWVEHDANEIWQTQYTVAKQALAQATVSAEEVAAIGITNQRETVVVWDRSNGQPLCNAIVWQDRRTAPICEELRAKGMESYIQQKTGLVVDAYFSATKVSYILEQLPGARELAQQGKLAFGTVDSWLIWKLTNGKEHLTDYSNASRTMMYDIHQLCWDSTILHALNIPQQMLPEVKPSSMVYATTSPELFDGIAIPIAGIAGDQQAALFGQSCFQQGMVKNTYGTGCFILMNIGEQPKKSENNLLTTIAWGLDGKVEYAFEGAVFIAGAVVQWLRDELGIIARAQDSEQLATAVENTAGVYLVPAFVGLGAPYWDMYARGCIQGLTRGCNKNHLVRAALESIAYQSRDTIECMRKDSGLPLSEIRVDGGASNNNFLMQFQADIIGVQVRRPSIVETTALGAAFLAGLAVGIWRSKDELSQILSIDRTFSATLADEKRQQLYSGWLKAVDRAKNWVKENVEESALT